MSHKRSHDEFLGSMKSILETGKYSDFTITCGDDTYKVHKSIVCAQSDFFDAASRFGREGREGKVDLPDDDPLIVKNMIEYMYGQDYQADLGTDDTFTVPERQIKVEWDTRKWEKEGCHVGRHELSCRDKRWMQDKLSKFSEDQVLKAVEIIEDERSPSPDGCAATTTTLHMSNKRDVKALSALWVHLMRNPDQADTNGRILPCVVAAFHHAQVYVLGDKYNIEGLKQAAAEKFGDAVENVYMCWFFKKTIEYIYEFIPKKDDLMKDIIARKLVEDLEAFRMCDMIDELLEDQPDLALRVLRSQMSVKGTECRDIQGTFVLSPDL